MAAVPTDRLVGRATELGLIDRALAGLADGHGGAVSVVGGPGIGKSRMLAELASRADARGYLVLAGSASELEGDLPFGVFVDAMDDFLESLEPRRLERLEPEVRVDLARMFPSLGSFGGRGETLQDERYRMHRAIRILLETLATKPLVLVLDDFHWTDAASLELVGALLRRPPAARVLLALGIRPHQLPSRPTAELHRAERCRTLTRIELAPLSPGDARTFLGDSVSPREADLLYEESGGVPFYLEQLARVPSRSRPPPRPAAVDGQPGADVPPMVLEALREELSLLSDQARRVLRGAAVAGDPFEPELAAVAAECPESAALDALDELLRLDFVRPTDVPRRFRFRHPVVRRAVYEAAPGGWRLAAHERSAEALAARGASAGARAHHVERSARHGSVDAVALLRTAGLQSAARAPETAARWFAAAWRLLPDDAASAERVELLLRRAEALAAAGRLHDSHDASLLGLEVTPAPAAPLQTRLITACAGVERRLGHQERAHKRLTAALAAAPPASPEAVALLLELANDGYYRNAFDAMGLWAGRSVVAAQAVGDAPLTAATHAMVSLAAAWTTAVDEAEAACATAARLVDGLTDAELATRLDAAANVAMARMSLADFPEAARHAERALAVGRATGQGQFAAPLYGIVGLAWAIGGRLADAAGLLDAALEAARLRDDEFATMWTLSLWSTVTMLLGDLDGALEAAQEAFEMSAGVEEGLMTAWSGMRLARVMMEWGDTERAIELMLTSAGGEAFDRIPAGTRALWLEVLTSAQLERGDVKAARRSAGHAAAWAAQVPLPLTVAMAELARARVELAAGRPADAAALALSAIAGAGRAGAHLDAARARIVAGRALADAGDRDAAIGQLQRAADEFGRFGATRYSETVRQDLRRLGDTARRRPRGSAAAGSGLGSLTERELEIARLAVDRLTNREIAKRLFLSEKTIETHMRNIFHKLGVSSRVEVARVTERADRRAGRGL